MIQTPPILTFGILLATAAFADATIIGFGQLGGNNTTVPAALGSAATADGNGFIVANGTTPDINLLWDANWDIHTSNFFTPLEAQTAVSANWDNEGSIPRVGQLDVGSHTIGFATAPTAALVLNSFDFGHTAETAGITTWSLALTNSLSTVVWSQAVTFTNGSTLTVAPNFTGALGEDYVLTFTRLTENYNSNGRHGIDNLSFNQSAIPEPGAVGLMALSGLALLARRRK